MGEQRHHSPPHPVGRYCGRSGDRGCHSCIHPAPRGNYHGGMLLPSLYKRTENGLT